MSSIDLLPIGDTLASVATVVLFVMAVVLFVLYGLPVLLALLDIVVVVVATALGVAGRVVFRRPWTVEARSATGEQRDVAVVGWRRARRACAVLARSIAKGVPPTGADPGQASWP